MISADGQNTNKIYYYYRFLFKAAQKTEPPYMGCLSSPISYQINITQTSRQDQMSENSILLNAISNICTAVQMHSMMDNQP